MLDLLALCHHYKIMKLYEFIHPFVLSMTNAQTLHDHLSGELSACRVLRYAHDLKCLEIGTYARLLVLGELWYGQTDHIFDALFFGVCTNQTAFTGAALYQVMIASEAVLNNDPRLANLRRRYDANFRMAMDRYRAKWDERFDVWGNTLPENSLGRLWKRLAKDKYSSCDMVKKMISIVDSEDECDTAQEHQLAANVRRELAALMNESFDIFEFGSPADIDLSDSDHGAGTAEEINIVTEIQEERINEPEQHWSMDSSPGEMLVQVENTLYRVC